ncbi:MAG: hypothetical protein J5977_04885 [Fibrobacter sp.]|nr:hypothetical protein [Fibrobacter sp.]
MKKVLIHKIVPSINLAYKSTNKKHQLCKQLFAKKSKKKFTPSQHRNIFGTPLPRRYNLIDIICGICNAEKFAQEKTPLSKGAQTVKNNERSILMLFTYFFYCFCRVTRNSRDVLIGKTNVKHSFNPIAVPLSHLFSKFFFLNFGNGLVAVNFAAFLKIHLELLLGIIIEPLFHKRARRALQKYACIFLLPSRRRGRRRRQIYISFRQKVLRFCMWERFKSCNCRFQELFEFFTRKNILQGNQGKGYLGRNLGNFVFAENVTDINEFQNERQTNFIKEFYPEHEQNNINRSDFI